MCCGGGGGGGGGSGGDGGDDGGGGCNYPIACHKKHRMIIVSILKVEDSGSGAKKFFNLHVTTY